MVGQRTKVPRARAWQNAGRQTVAPGFGAVTAAVPGGLTQVTRVLLQARETRVYVTRIKPRALWAAPLSKMKMPKKQKFFLSQIPFRGNLVFW